MFVNFILLFRMASELLTYEADINAIIKEYLTFNGLDKTAYSLQLECKERGKQISSGRKNEGDGTKLTAQVLLV